MAPAPASPCHKATTGASTAALASRGWPPVIANSVPNESSSRAPGVGRPAGWQRPDAAESLVTTQAPAGMSWSAAAVSCDPGQPGLGAELRRRLPPRPRRQRRRPAPRRRPWTRPTVPPGSGRELQARPQRRPPAPAHRGSRPAGSATASARNGPSKARSASSTAGARAALRSPPRRRAARTRRAPRAASGRRGTAGGDAGDHCADGREAAAVRGAGPARAAAAGADRGQLGQAPVGSLPPLAFLTSWLDCTSAHERARRKHRERRSGTPRPAAAAASQRPASSGGVSARARQAGHGEREQLPRSSTATANPKAAPAQRRARRVSDRGQPVAVEDQHRAGQAAQVQPRLEEEGVRSDQRVRVYGVQAARDADRERAPVPDEDAEQEHVRRVGAHGKDPGDRETPRRPRHLGQQRHGVMSSTLPGGCTTAKSRYGTAPLTRRSQRCRTARRRRIRSRRAGRRAC